MADSGEYLNERFAFKPSVYCLHKHQRLVLIDLSSNKTHVIEGNLAQSLIKLCSPCALIEIIEDIKSDISELIIEFLRLSNHGFIISARKYLNPIGKSSEVSFWEDAHIYHLLSRTTIDSSFLPRKEQHKRFLQNVRLNKDKLDYIGPKGDKVNLPAYNGQLPTRDFTDVIYSRRSKRIFERSPVPLLDFSWLLSVTWGNNLSCIDRPHGLRTNLRTSPSCGGLQSVQVYPIVLNVENLRRGVYWYDPDNHSLVTIDLVVTDQWVLEACAHQEWVNGVAVLFIMTAKVNTLMLKYNVSRLYRMLHVEAGHFSQTFQLCSEFLGKAACLFGAMNEEVIEQKLKIDIKNEPILFVTGLGEFDQNSEFDNWIKGF